MPDESTTHATFRTNMRRDREARGWTQGELARALGEAGWPTLAHQTTLARLESGQRPPRLDEATAIAAVLDTTLDRLLSAPEAVVDLHNAEQQVQATFRHRHDLARAAYNLPVLQAALKLMREGITARVEAGEYAGPMGDAADRTLRHIDDALAMTVEDAVNEGLRKWKQHPASTRRKGKDDA